MPVNTVPVASATNDGAHAVVVFQKKAGVGLVWIGGCLQVRGAGTENYNDAYEYCMGLDGKLRRYDIPQASDPTPMQVSARSDVELQQKLFQLWQKSRDNGCGFNMGVFVRKCLTQGKERDASNFDRQFWFYGLRGTGRVQFGNDTLVTDNFKQTALQEDQMSFINDGVAVTMPIKSTQYATAPVKFTSMAVADIGQCASQKCGDGIARPGGRIIIGAIAATPAVHLSVDGGSNWTDISATVTGATRVFAFKGYLYAMSATAIYVGIPNPAGTAVSWTTAVADQAFAALAGLTLGKDDILIAVGENTQVWASQNAGGNFVRVASGQQVTTTGATQIDFKGVTRLGEHLYGVGRNDAGTQTVFVRSTDNGRTWTLDGYIVAAAPATYEGTPQQWRVVWNLAGSLYQHEAGAVGASTINPAGIATVHAFFLPDENSPNDVLISSSARLGRSLDGGVTNAAITNIGTLGAETVSCFAPVIGAEQNYALFAYGTTIYKLAQDDSLWV